MSELNMYQWSHEIPKFIPMLLIGWERIISRKERKGEMEGKGGEGKEREWEGGKEGGRKNINSK